MYWEDGHCYGRKRSRDREIRCSLRPECQKGWMGRPYWAGGSDGKASVYNVGDPHLIPGLGRSPGEGNGNPL